MRSRRVIAVATVKSIESRVADRGFWLQTGCIVKVFSYDEADGGSWVGPGKRGSAYGTPSDEARER
jgi:hypothetical protein